MKWSRLLIGLFAASGAIASRPTDALYDLVKRRLPDHVDDFRFNLVSNATAAKGYDHFKVETTQNGTVLVHGTTVSALSSGYVESYGFLLGLHNSLTITVFTDT